MALNLPKGEREILKSIARTFSSGIQIKKLGIHLTQKTRNIYLSRLQSKGFIRIGVIPDFEIVVAIITKVGRTILE